MVIGRQHGGTSTRIVMLQGLPASGKSTRANVMLCESPEPMVRVNKDSLRAMLHGTRPWSREREALTRSAEIAIVNQMLESGVSVVVDDTNLGPYHLGIWSEVAEAHGLILEVEIVNTPVAECIHRDSVRGMHRVGRTVIAGMAREYLSHKTAGMDAVFDLDGTLADNSHRIPNPAPEGFDYEATAPRVISDAPILPMVQTLMDHYRVGHRILFLTGREESGRKYTEGWLRKHGLYEICEMVIMRPVKDHRSVHEFKVDALRRYCDPGHVAMVYDDNPDTVAAITAAGFTATIATAIAA